LVSRGTSVVLVVIGWLLAIFGGFYEGAVFGYGSPSNSTGVALFGAILIFGGLILCLIGLNVIRIGSGSTPT
jgi:hypothetical protein